MGSKPNKTERPTTTGLMARWELFGKSQSYTSLKLGGHWRASGSLRSKFKQSVFDFDQYVTMRRIQKGSSTFSLN